MEEETLKTKITELASFESQFIQSSKRILEAGNQKLFVLDLLSGAVNNRAIALIKGFILLANDKNYISAIPLIRLQLDNGLRFFASTLVKDSNDFFSHYLDGKPIRDYKDAFGKNLTDNYLSEKLGKIFPGVNKLYKETSGHIHLSDQHLFITTKQTNFERTIAFSIGSHDNYSTESKIDFVNTMIEVSKLVLIVVEQWKHEKIRLSNSFDDNQELRN